MISEAKRELQRKHWMVDFKPLIEMQPVPRRYWREAGPSHHGGRHLAREATKYFEQERLRKEVFAGNLVN